MLDALAQTGNRRGLDALMAAADSPHNTRTRGEIARGLARIGAPKALPALAKFARMRQASSDLQSTWEAVTAFGRASGRFKAPPPAPYWSNLGVDTGLVQKGLADIDPWERAGQGR
jgi:HEAT repeat protein